MRFLLFLILVSGCTHKLPREVDEAMVKVDQAEQDLIQAIKKKRYLDSRV